MAQADMFRFEAYYPDRPNKNILHSSDILRVAVVYLEAGLEIPPHSSGGEVVMHVVKGKGTIYCGDQNIPVGPGSIVVCSQGKDHGVKADERMALVVAVSNMKA